MSEFTGGTTPTYFSSQNKLSERKREALIAWLESMPWWSELPYAQLKAEKNSLWAQNVALRELEKALQADNERLRDLLVCIEQDGIESWHKEIDALKEDK